MKLSLRADYALRALMALADSQADQVVPIQSISRQQEIPKRFLEQILNDLKAGGFVESKRGIAGGYRLAKPVSEIPIGQVIRHVEGSLSQWAGTSEKTITLRPGAEAARKAVRSVMREVSAALSKMMNGITIGDLCEQARQLRREHAEAPDYAI